MKEVKVKFQEIRDLFYHDKLMSIIKITSNLALHSGCSLGLAREEPLLPKIRC